MISLFLAFALEAMPSKRYETCGQSADTVIALRQQVVGSSDFVAVKDSGEWNARTNNRDTTWLFPVQGKAGEDIAICRKLVSGPSGTFMETHVLCDGSDAACDAARDRLVGPSASGGRTKL